jgi:cell division protein FtsQ
LVDGSGVLLNMPVDAQAKEHYSFPVVTGISGNDPLSTRAARMKIFERFTSELDGAGEKISEQLSEVELSNPEDVQAMIPDHSTEILVHFGEDNFLERYRRFKEHLPEWRTLYPKLSSVDMRYEQQVVLQMPPGSAAPAEAGGPGSKAVISGDSTALKSAPPVAQDGAATSAAKAVGKAGDRKPAGRAPIAATHGEAKKSAPKAKPHAAAAKHSPAVMKHPAAAGPHYSNQVAHP